MFARDRGERLVGPLKDPLRSDVDPGPRGHLPVHRQAGVLEPAEFLPRRPARHDESVRDEHARRPLVRAEDTDRLSRLHQERLVLLESCECGEDSIESCPRARGTPCSAIDDELIGALRDVRVEIVLDHAERGLLRPAEAVQRIASRSANGTCRDRHGLNCPSPPGVPPDRTPPARWGFLDSPG